MMSDPSLSSSLPSFYLLSQIQSPYLAKSADSYNGNTGQLVEEKDLYHLARPLCFDGRLEERIDGSILATDGLPQHGLNHAQHHDSPRPRLSLSFC